MTIVYNECIIYLSDNYNERKILMKQFYIEPEMDIKRISAEDIMENSDVITDGEDWFDPEA